MLEKGASLSSKPTNQINDAAEGELRVSAHLKVGGVTSLLKKRVVNRYLERTLENLGL